MCIDFKSVYIRVLFSKPSKKTVFLKHRTKSFFKIYLVIIKISHQINKKNKSSQITKRLPHADTSIVFFLNGNRAVRCQSFGIFSTTIRQKSSRYFSMSRPKLGGFF